MANINSKIGVFDSGVGGLTVLKELLEFMPNEKYLYLADLKNNPYGDKNGEEIERFSRKIIEYFISQEVKVIVIACNTASSYNIDKIRTDYEIPIFTVLEAGVSEVNSYKKILLAATKATCKAGVYKRLIEDKNKDNQVEVLQEACIDIVPSIEANNLSKEQIQYVVDYYISKYKGDNIDLLLLGCTHYPLWNEYFRKSVGDDVYILNPAKKLAEQVKKYLEQAYMLVNNSNLEVSYVVTDKKNNFYENSKKIIDGIKLDEIKLVNL